jgi:hypothetical protein
MLLLSILFLPQEVFFLLRKSVEHFHLLRKIEILLIFESVLKYFFLDKEVETQRLRIHQDIVIEQKYLNGIQNFLLGKQ